MGSLASDLKSMGYEPTGEESPFEDGGYLWSDGTELVCDETGIVLDGRVDERIQMLSGDHRAERHQYPGSGKLKMIGGYVHAYGDDSGQIRY